MIRISTVVHALACPMALALAVTVLATTPSDRPTNFPAAVPVAKSAEPVTERPDRVSAVLAARLQDSRVEISSERTETTTVFANPDGSFSMDVTPNPIRVQRGDGWVPVDTTLEREAGEIAPAAAADDLSLGTVGESVFAEASDVDTKGREVSFGLGLDDPLPAPTLDGDQATYPDVLPGTDLVVTAKPQGFSHDLIIGTRQAEPVGSIDLSMDLTGLRASVGASGRIVLADRDGRPVYTAPAPVMWDARINEASGDPAQTRRVEAEIRTEGGRSTLELTPDQAFLDDPTTVYPVTIDPSFTKYASDAWVQYNNYLDSQGGSEELRVGTYDGGTHKARSYLQFALPAGFAGTVVSAAELKLWNWYSGSCTGSAIEARRVTSGAWTSGGFTSGHPTNRHLNRDGVAVGRARLQQLLRRGLLELECQGHRASLGQRLGQLRDQTGRSQRGQQQHLAQVPVRQLRRRRHRLPRAAPDRHLQLLPEHTPQQGHRTA